MCSYTVDSGYLAHALISLSRTECLLIVYAYKQAIYNTAHFQGLSAAYKVLYSYTVTVANPHQMRAQYK